MRNVDKPQIKGVGSSNRACKPKSGHFHYILRKSSLLYGLILLELAGFLAAGFVFAQGTLITGGLSRIRVADTLVTVEGGFITEVIENELHIRALSLSPRIILENDPVVSSQAALEESLPGDNKLTGLPLPEDESQGIGSAGQDNLAQAPPESAVQTFELKISNIDPQAIILEGDAQLQRNDREVTIKVALAACEKKVLKLQTPLPDTDSFSFAVMGDSRGSERTFKSILKKLNQTKPLFAVNCGDLVENGKRGEYRRFKRQISRFKYPLFFSLGNHDILWWGRMVYQEYFGPTYYSFDFGESHFIFLDNALGRIDDYQFRWLEHDLQQNTKAHTFMFMHIPPFDPRPDKYHAMNSQLNAQYLMDLASRYQVDRVFCSHIHEYLREEREGVVYIITGGAGAELRNPDAFYHYVLITVGPDGITEEVIKVP